MRKEGREEVANIVSTEKHTPDGNPIVPDDSDEPITPGEFVQPEHSPKLGTRPTPGPSYQPLHRKQEPPTRDFEDVVMDVKSRSTDRRVKHPKPTATALGIGIKRLALLITSIVVFQMLEDERARLTDQEATALGIALGNLLQPTTFNEQWGWIIAETGDWQALGFIAIVYVSRVGGIIREKQQTHIQSSIGNIQTIQSVQTQPQQPAPGAYQPG